MALRVERTPDMEIRGDYPILISEEVLQQFHRPGEKLTVAWGRAGRRRFLHADHHHPPADLVER